MSLNAYKPTLIAHLEAHTPHEANEARHVADMLRFLRTQPEPFARQASAGHITGSAVLVEETGQFTALIWHEKLGRWLQPGGHCEPTLDQSVPDTALRELVEETTIAARHITRLQATPFDVDVHPIPAREDEPAHIHYDVRYLFQAPRAALPGDTSRYQWKPIAEVAASEDMSRARFAQKLLARIAQNTPKNWD